MGHVHTHECLNQHHHEDHHHNEQHMHQQLGSLCCAGVCEHPEHQIVIDGNQQALEAAIRSELESERENDKKDIIKSKKKKANDTTWLRLLESTT